jgi:hypothetical protein
MPTNGAAVALPLVPEPLPAPAPHFDEQLGGIEGWIGAILVALEDTSAQALREIENGGLTDKTRMQGGDLLARLYALQQQSRGKLDFAAAVRREGQLQLRRRHGVDLSTAEVDQITSSILEVVAKVTAAVQAEMN